MEHIKKWITKEKIIICLIILLATILSSFFIFNDELIKGVDTEYHLSRIKGIVESWKAGDFLAYIHLDETGYGYAMGFFYSNLFMLIPCILYLLGMDLFLAYKIFIFLCGIFTAISMYICVKQITKNKYSAIIAMFLCTTCSYRIITIVAKAFVGEILSFIFIPIIILGLYKLIFEDEKKWWIFSIGFVGLLNSNLVMTEIMIIISFLIVILNIKNILNNKNRLVGFAKATILALLVSAVFWMPMLEQLNKSTFNMNSYMNIYKPENWLIDFKDLLFGTIQYKNNLAAAYGLGLIFIIILPFRIKIKDNNNIIRFCDILLLISLIALIMMTNIFPWEHLSTLGGSIQFPSRLEVFVSIAFSIICGCICGYIKKNKVKRVIFILIVCWQVIASILCLNSCIEIIKKHYAITEEEDIYLSKDFEYNVCDGVYLPEGAIYSLAQADHESENNELKTNNENIEYTYEKNNLTITINFENNNTDETYIEVPIYYYYGYIAKSTIDETEYKLEKGENGVIRIYLGEKQEDTIYLYYNYTGIQKISIIISITTCIGIGIYLAIKHRKNVKNQRRKIKCMNMTKKNYRIKK